VTEERDLIARAREGDEEAFGILVRRHQDQVWRTAARLVGDEEASDVAQEVFLKAWRELRRFKGNSALGTWLYRMTVNLALNQIRGTRRELARRERFGPGVSAPAPDPESAAEAEETTRLVWAAIEALPERHRVAVTLHRFEGLSAAETAEVMGLTTAAVEALLHRAKGMLLRDLARRGLGGEGEPGPGPGGSAGRARKDGPVGSKKRGEDHEDHTR
jgi:RNA polymerase sigma-70 factor (ECF subfamily)